MFPFSQRVIGLTVEGPWAPNVLRMAIQYLHCFVKSFYYFLEISYKF